MFNRLIAWSLVNRLIILVMTVLLFLGGAIALKQMPVDVFPEFAPPQVVIQTEAPGLAPTDVEALVTYPLESVINGTPGVNSVRSRTSVGLSTITVIFKAGSDIYRDRQLVNERIQTMPGRLPVGARPPIMLPVTSAVGWLVKYALTSESVSPEELRTLSDWEIRPRILALGGIASVMSIGGDVKQYQVRLDPHRMLAYRISLDEVRRALKKSNIIVPGGFLEKPGQEFIIAAMGRINSLADLKNTVILLRDGVPITIDNIAKVAFGGAIKRGDAAFGLQKAVIGTISKAYGADTVTTTKKVEKALDDVKAHLPRGIQLRTQVFRQANFIEAAIHNLKIALLEGALIILVVLFLFLMNWRASMITFLSMPASFAGGVLVMHALGIGINAMTLGGLAIAIGEVVDNGIIAVENVVRRLRINAGSPRADSPLEVVFDAVREILNSVVYATLIIVTVFLPIFFLQGLAGRIFAPLGVAYIASVLASLAISVTMIPVLCYLLLVRDKEQDRHIERLDQAPPEHLAEPASAINTRLEAEETPFVRWLKGHFQNLLLLALGKVRWVVALAGVPLALAIVLLPFLGHSFLPEFHEGNYIIAMTTLPGTSLEESMRLGGAVRRTLLQYPQVVSIDQRTGRSELDEDAQPPNFSEFDVRLDFSRNPGMPPEVLLSRIRENLQEVPGAVFNVGQFIAHRMDEVQSGVRAQVAVKIFGQNLSTLYQMGQRVQRILREIPGVVDVNVEQQIRVPQVTIRINREKAARYGINIGDATQDIRMLLNGETESSILEGQRAFDLYVRMDHKWRNSVESIRNILVEGHPSNSGTTLNIPLREVADVKIRDQPYTISRENTQRLIVVAFNIQGRDLTSVIRETKDDIRTRLKLPSGYFVEYGGQFESQQQANRILLGFGVFALFFALVIMHKVFGTLRESLLVLLNLPLAMIGGVVALFLSGADLSVAALIGFITLFGIAIRNGIILISHYHQLKKEGKPLRDIVVQGTLDRLVPVLMTATTAALGLLPILWGSPVGKELERPLAQVVLGGLLTSTLLTLIVLPTMYNQIETWQETRKTGATLHQNDRKR